MKNSTEGVAYLLRKTGLTLTEIRKLGPGQFRELFTEVAYQESVEEYNQATYVANILAAIANTIPRKSNKAYKASDFLEGGAPSRGGETKESTQKGLEAMAAKAGIEMPTGG